MAINLHFCSSGFDNTFATTTEGRGSPIPRTGSPDRTASPSRLMRAVSPTRDLQLPAVDVDPEAVRMALRDFVNQLANAERERVCIDNIMILFCREDNSIFPFLTFLKTNLENPHSRLSTNMAAVGMIV